MVEGELYLHSFKRRSLELLNQLENTLLNGREGLDKAVVNTVADS